MSITPKNITIEKRPTGGIWLMVPYAAICLSTLPFPYNKFGLVRWAENELSADQDLLKYLEGA